MREQLNGGESPASLDLDATLPAWSTLTEAEIDAALSELDACDAR